MVNSYSIGEKNKFPLKWPSPSPSPSLLATRTNKFLYRSSFYTIELRIDVVVKESFESVREHVMGKITVCLFFFTEYKISHVEHVARWND